MTIDKLIEKIRTEHGYSFGIMGEKVGFSKAMMEAVEKKKSPVSRNVLEGLIKAFPIYENQLIKAYLNQFLREDLQERISVGNLKRVEKEADKYKLKTYLFQSAGSGEIDLDSYEEIEYPLPVEVGKKIQKNGYVFKVQGENMKPNLLENDIIVFYKEEFQGWEAVDSRLILVEKNDKMFMRKLFFDEGKPFLVSFNPRLYPKLEVTEDTKYIGQLSQQLDRIVTKIEF